MKIGSTIIQQLGNILVWNGRLRVNCDGAPTAYANPSSGLPALDIIANAGHVGNWWALACDDNGTPYEQPSGYLVSTTALVDPTKENWDQSKYVDQSVIRGITIPPDLLHGTACRKGDVAMVVNLDAGRKRSAAIVCDIGPMGQIGEGSPALCAALGLSPDALHGGAERSILTALFMGSSRGWPRTNEDIAQQVVELMAAWQNPVRGF